MTNPTPDSSPLVVSKRQLLLAAYTLCNITEEDIRNAIVDVLGPDSDLALIDWTYTTSIERDYPLVSSLGDYFDLSTEDLDQLFLHAYNLKHPYER